MTFSQIYSVFYRFCAKMSSLSYKSLSPVDVRGMKILDREKFSRHIQVPILKVTGENLSKIATLCKPYFLKLPNLKPIQQLDPGSEEEGKCILLNPLIVSDWSDISMEHRSTLENHDIREINFSKKDIKLTYENWSVDSIFKAVLPEGEETVSGFSQIGHIVHLNLREHLLDYENLIGQVLIDKLKTCKTVVRKNDIINNTYRFFDMKVLAGSDDCLVTVKENQCTFQFDFTKVYWNPRLCKEHERILNLIKPGDVLFDIFSGVGPFAIPAAKRKCIVYANDLNPESYKWLNHNAKLNKVDKPSFKTYNQDGKDFICDVFKDFIINYCNGTEKIANGAKIHITMNLPGLAVEFLPYFNNLIEDQMTIIDKMNFEITVYVYCFAIGTNSVEIAKKMVSDNMKMDMSPFISDVFKVRNVAPNKEMMRVTFMLSKEIIFRNLNNVEGPPAKKQCI